MKPAAILFVVLVAPGTGVSAQVQKSEVPGVTNFSRVDATVGCGGATAPAAMAELRRQGFRAVINLRQASEPGAEIEASRAAAEAAGLQYIHLPFDVANPSPTLVDGFLAAVAEPSNQPVYIHCGTANRVGAMWMIKRALQDGWDTARAQDEAEAIGLTSARLKEFATSYIAAHRK